MRFHDKSNRQTNRAGNREAILKKTPHRNDGKAHHKADSVPQGQEHFAVHEKKEHQCRGDARRKFSTCIPHCESSENKGYRAENEPSRIGELDWHKHKGSDEEESRWEIGATMTMRRNKCGTEIGWNLPYLCLVQSP